MSRIHREKMLFKWMTKNYEIFLGFKRVHHDKCSKCGKPVRRGSNLCEDCFIDMKKISDK